MNMTGVFLAISLIWGFSVTGLTALMTMRSAPWETMLLIWLIWVTGSPLAFWTSSLKPLSLAICWACFCIAA